MSLHRFFGGKSTLRAIARNKKSEHEREARNEAERVYPQVKQGHKNYAAKQAFIADRIHTKSEPHRRAVKVARVRLKAHLVESAERGRAK